MRNLIAFSVDLLPRDRIADMFRDRCSGVSQSISCEYILSRGCSAEDVFNVAVVTALQSETA
jgi:hypothetical protein